MSGINFNVPNVIKSCKKMNSARRNILSVVNKMKSIYGSVTLNTWSGSSRKIFHEEVFGIDGNSGLLGVIGTGNNGICSALNDLLFHLAEYVCSTTNKDAEYTKNYTYINTHNFVDNSVSIAPVTNWINYEQINAENVIISPEALSAVEERYLEYCNEMTNYVQQFNQALKELINEGIKDQTTKALERVISLLNTRIEEFKVKVKHLLHNNESIVSSAMSYAQQASAQNAEIASIINNLDFD